MAERVDWSRERGAMLAFAMHWAPYGGGDPEDIWITFGISARTYFLRLQALLNQALPAGVDDDTWRRLQQLCADRLTTDPEVA
ncbi:DUF3263 domain-containing protein [Gordonia lacunae]|uniref:DUF3263 domain-containing protein n=1 Tax=Gordonia lacunae TaxID=417102 RepID=UPI0039E4A495